jgi:hypothetical protein
MFKNEKFRSEDMMLENVPWIICSYISKVFPHYCLVTQSVPMATPTPESAAVFLADSRRILGRFCWLCCLKGKLLNELAGGWFLAFCRPGKFSNKYSFHHKVFF